MQRQVWCRKASDSCGGRKLKDNKPKHMKEDRDGQLGWSTVIGKKPNSVILFLFSGVLCSFED
jgi:hypothetical protein